MRDEGELWGLVLAAGEGRRLAAVTTDGAGRPAPKQFCALAGETPLLERTIDRVARLTARRRIVAVVAEAHRPFWAERAGALPAANWIVQPEGRGTAAGLLLPLLEIARRDPDARVLVTPSDHHFADEAAFDRAVLDALSALERPLDRVLLVGIAPDSPAGDLGWVVPEGGRRRAGRDPLRVARFVEKPGVEEAERLRAAGAVWNSFVLVARARTLLELYARRAPELLAALRDSSPDRIATVYAGLPELDFSRGLLAGSEDRLGLVIAPPCGWTDLGTPERLARASRPRPSTPAGRRDARPRRGVRHLPGFAVAVS